MLVPAVRADQPRRPMSNEELCVRSRRALPRRWRPPKVTIVVAARRGRPAPGLPRRGATSIASTGPSSASASRRRPHGRSPASARRPGTSRTSSGRSAPATSPSTRSGGGRRGDARDRPRATRPGRGRARCASWPTSPGHGCAGSDRGSSVVPLRPRPSLRALQRPVPHHDASSCPPSPTPRPAACLEARAANGPLRRRDALGPAPLRRLRRARSAPRPQATGRATTASPYFVVVHVPLAALVDDAGEASDLAGELERDGLISCETVRQIACDATIAIAVDDDVGHTMYEGRARRYPTDAQRREVMRRDRHCRFPGCTNVTFTNVHHIVPWKPGGQTDLDNLALLCLHHHHLVHSKGWTMTGERQRGAAPSSARPAASWRRAPRRCGRRCTAGPAGSDVPDRAQPRRPRSSAATSLPLAFPDVAFMTAPVKNPISLSSPSTKRAHSSGLAAMTSSSTAPRVSDAEGLEAHLLGHRRRVSPAPLEQRAQHGLGLGRRELAARLHGRAAAANDVGVQRQPGLALGGDLVGGPGQGQRDGHARVGGRQSPARRAPGRRPHGSGPSRRRSAPRRAPTASTARRSAGMAPRPARTRSCHAASGARGTRSGSGK